MSINNVTNIIAIVVPSAIAIISIWFTWEVLKFNYKKLKYTNLSELLNRQSELELEIRVLDSLAMYEKRTSTDPQYTADFERKERSFIENKIVTSNKKGIGYLVKSHELQLMSYLICQKFEYQNREFESYKSLLWKLITKKDKLPEDLKIHTKSFYLKEITKKKYDNVPITE